MLAKMVEGGMTLEEAREYFEFNVVGAWVGETTPVYIEDYKSYKDVEDKVAEKEEEQ
jgi:hypothetical protein